MNVIRRHRIIAVIFSIAVLLTVGAVADAQTGLPPLGPITAPPTGQVPPPPVSTINAYSVGQAFAVFAWDVRATGGNVPGGCATLNAHHYCAPKVNVDGAKISDLELIGPLMGLTTASGGPSGGTATFPAGSEAANHAAISQAVLERLVLLQAKKDGVTVSTAQGTAQAEQELATYNSLRTSDPRQPPPCSRQASTLRPTLLTQRRSWPTPTRSPWERRSDVSSPPPEWACEEIHVLPLSDS
jgi:hypothetical protein